jgi:octaheme c-type cytochrome (tetrathionate reductase family)
LNRFLRGARALAAMALVALAACSDDEKQCEDFCGAGAACVAGSCVAYEPCAEACAEGQACQDGACVATLASACGGACTGADEICVTGDGAAECVTVCGEGQGWNAATDTCEATAAYCGEGQSWNATTLRCDATAAYCGAGQTWDAVALECRMTDLHAAWFDGKTLSSGPAVTTECIKCHADEAADFMQTQHWTWKGPTPQLYDVVDFAADPLALRDPGTIGKANLINNFCVSVGSNEKRCEQCHAGYGTTVSARSGANATDPTRVDCLVCHSGLVKANMTGVSATIGYSKVAGNFGAAGINTGAAATAESLKAAASSVGTPTRANCGFCHFNAGGADSVKILSTSLDAPTAAVDVHMSPAGNDLTCAACHADSNHRVKGAGVHTPTNTARASCEDCHGAAPHDSETFGATLNGHTDVLACQTCHIPAYSRGQPGKIDWDWATAGFKSKGSITTCLDASNVESAPAADGTCPTGQWKVKAYDNQKGNFRWGVNVKPAYAWYNGKMTHVTTLDKGALAGSQTGLSPAARITLSAPLGDSADATAKIFPFKLMTGRQAVYVDGDSSFIIVPNLFSAVAGDGAFWGVTTHASYVYTPADGEAFGVDPLRGTYVAPGYPTTPVTAATSIESLLSTNFTTGARAAGQIAADATLARFDGTTGWDWRYTQMYMDLNHEVAPAAQALGCASCHSSTGASVIDWTQLGYGCANPSGCAKRP